MTAEILTSSGRYFNFNRPEESDFGIVDIAHALSNLCRFNGHVNRFYSVAQHSVLVSRLVPADLALAGLLHDGHEAFLGDVSAPLKTLLPDYRAIEERIEKVVRTRFFVPETMPPAVKRADMRALATERRDLMNVPDGDEWPCLDGLEPDEKIIWPETPAEAYAAFLNRYAELRS